MKTLFPNTILSHLQDLAQKDDQDIDLAETALMLAQIQYPDISPDRYEHHLKLIAKQTHERFVKLKTKTAKNMVDTIRSVLMDEQGYKGDNETYDDLQNINLIRVIERRKGLPIILCILSLHIARAQGWTVHGLTIPGHVLCRLDQDGQRIIFDPFNNCQELDAAGVRSLIKKTVGAHAELSATYFEPSRNRDILIRLQNNLKFRQIENEDYDNALKTVETMRSIDPDEYRLLLEAGVLYARVGQSLAAIDNLERYITLAPDNQDRHEASMLLQDLRTSLN